MDNLDVRTVADFGREWTTFDQSAVAQDGLRRLFDEYFHIFPWEVLPDGAIGFDLGVRKRPVGPLRRTTRQDLALHRCKRRSAGGRQEQPGGAGELRVS